MGLKSAISINNGTAVVSFDKIGKDASGTVIFEDRTAGIPEFAPTVSVRVVRARKAVGKAGKGSAENNRVYLTVARPVLMSTSSLTAQTPSSQLLFEEQGKIAHTCSIRVEATLPNMSTTASREAVLAMLVSALADTDVVDAFENLEIVE